MRILKRLFWGLFWLSLIGSGYLLVTHPKTPLPPQWNALQPLDVAHPVTPITSWKVSKIGNDPDLCRSALATVAQFQPMPDFEADTDQCHIRSRVRVTEFAGVRIFPTEMRCDLALKTALWLQHGVLPAARDYLGQGISKMRTQGSFNCRNIAGTTRRSTHSTASALDVAGFTLADDTKVELQRDWGGGGAKANFLTQVRDASCKWYSTTLGPEYNAAHADHFHLQSTGWGICS